MDKNTNNLETLVLEGKSFEMLTEILRGLDFNEFPVNPKEPEVGSIFYDGKNTLYLTRNIASFNTYKSNLEQSGSRSQYFPKSA